MLNLLFFKDGIKFATLCEGNIFNPINSCIEANLSSNNKTRGRGVFFHFYFLLSWVCKLDIFGGCYCNFSLVLGFEDCLRLTLYIFTGLLRVAHSLCSLKSFFPYLSEVSLSLSLNLFCIQSCSLLLDSS